MIQLQRDNSRKLHLKTLAVIKTLKNNNNYTDSIKLKSALNK